MPRRSMLKLVWMLPAVGLLWGPGPCRLAAQATQAAEVELPHPQDQPPSDEPGDARPTDGAAEGVGGDEGTGGDDADDMNDGEADRVMESERVLRDLLGEREAAEDRGVEPRRTGEEGPGEMDPGVGLKSVEPEAVDPALLGVAPGVATGDRPVLRREGEFVLARDGRLRRLEGSGDDPLRPGILFVFDADSADAAEPPMILQPCRLLESMEALAARQGPDTVFTVTGQVYTYGGANYLLPTMMKIRVARENLD